MEIMQKIIQMLNLMDSHQYHKNHFKARGCVSIFKMSQRITIPITQKFVPENFSIKKNKLKKKS